MWPSLPTSDYYGGSATVTGHRRNGPPYHPGDRFPHDR